MAYEYSIRYLRRRRMRGRSPAAAPAPFVVGVGRSGTTLLRMMLDAHPQLAIPPETHFLNPVIQASGRIRFTPATACRTIVHDQRRRWNDFGLDEADLLARFQAVDPFNTSDALRAFYELYAEKHGKQRWGDKTPDYIRKMRKIQNTLPEARFVHVIRDGRDAGLSQNARIAKRGKAPVPARELARRWRKRIVKSRVDAEKVEHYLEVRYEDLIADTEAVLRRICAHVELDFDPVMLNYHERAEERLQEMAGALPAKKGRPEREAGERVAAHAMTTKPPDSERVAVWKREMSEAENAEFEEAAGHLLDGLGYETATPRENWIPPEEWAGSKARGDRGEDGKGSGPLSGFGRRSAGQQPRPSMGLLSRLKRDNAGGRAPAVFVVGMNRSGTTLLRMMLDAHPELTIPPETHFVPDLIKAAREHDATPEDALAAMKSAREWGDFGFTDEEMLGRLRALDAIKPGPAVRTFYEAYMEQQGKPRWGEKTPTYVQKMKLIQRAVGEARFVHVIRDGRDVALSVLDRTVRDLTAADIANRWQKKITKAREDSPQLEHYMEIRYEDLILDTEPVLRRVCEFIELPWDEAMLSYHERSGERLKEMARALPGDGRAKELSVERRMATHAMTTKPPSADRVARWRTQMTAEQRADFEAIAGELLAELGYPTGADAVEKATAQIEAA